MSYQAIDSVIEEWANRHRLHVATKYKDDDVRSVDLVGTDGSKCQIWIEVPDEKGRVNVNVWNYRNRRIRYQAESSDGLLAVLEKAYAQAREWVAEGERGRV